MKNRLLLTAVSALMVLGLAACGPTTTTTTTTGGGNTTDTTSATPVDVPTEDGKITLAFRLGAPTAAELPEYVGIFASGFWTEHADESGTWNTTWATGLDCPEFKLLEGSENVYYAMVDDNLADYKGAQTGQYSLLLGYASTSSAPSKGLVWNDAYKSNECLSYAYPANPEWTLDGKIAWLTTTDNPDAVHNFATLPPEPILLKNYTMTFQFKVEDTVYEVPSWADAYLVGSLNGWADTGDLAEKKLTKVVDEKEGVVYRITIESVVAGSSMDYQVILGAAGITETGELDWGHPMTDGNQSYTFYEIDGDNYTTDPIVIAKDPSVVWPDPSKNVNVDFIFTNTEDGGEIGEGLVPGITGSFTGWSYTAMTLDGEDWKVTLSVPISEGLQFGVTSDSAWTFAIAGEGGANFSFDCTADTKTVTVTANFGDFGTIAKGVGVLTVA